MPASPDEVYSLITAIRACFRELRTLGDAMHADIGITAAMRAVMEHLADEKAVTVPDIARAKQVSRQSVQVLVDSLSAAGLAEVQANPEHKRSVLVALTAMGRQTFKGMRDRELVALAAIAADLPQAGAEGATRTLGALLRRLEAETGKYPTTRKE